MKTTPFNQPKITFIKRGKGDFFSTAKERVEEYFKENRVSRHATLTVILKACGIGIAFITLYSLILAQVAGPLVLLFLAILLGLVEAMIGFNIAHDALHGAFSSNSKINKALGYTFDFIGLSSWVWKITHNYHHHVYTNIPGMDHDIDKAVLLRLSPKDKLYWFHYFQNWYIFLLYTLTGFNWIFLSDYKFFFHEHKKKRISTWEAFAFFFFKALNFTVFIGIPLLIMTLPWWQILIGYAAMQMAGGFFVAIVFQLAHMVEEVNFFAPDLNGLVPNEWAAHELKTTANFGTNNRFLNFICGGLNFQVEHHLFPFISHGHYKEISKIVRSTAQEFGLPYNESPSMIRAVRSHLRMVKRLGRAEMFKFQTELQN